MVAAGEHIDPEGQQLIRNLWRNAKSSRGILSVGNHQIDTLRLPNIRQMVGHNAAAGMSVNVPNKEDLHARPVTAPSEAELTRATYFAKTPVG